MMDECGGGARCARARDRSFRDRDVIGVNRGKSHDVRQAGIA
jgi:hypothetical protein